MRVTFFARAKKVTKESAPRAPPSAAVPWGARQSGSVLKLGPQKAAGLRWPQTSGPEAPRPVRLRSSAAPKGRGGQGPKQNDPTRHCDGVGFVLDLDLDLDLVLDLDLGARRGRREAQRPREVSGADCMSPAVLCGASFRAGPRARASQGSPPRDGRGYCFVFSRGPSPLSSPFLWLLSFGEAKESDAPREG